MICLRSACAQAFILSSTLVLGIPFDSEFNIPGTHKPRGQNSGYPLGNSHDMVYTADISLGGDKYTLPIDSGSSNFWVFPSNKKDVSDSKDTGEEARIGYSEFAVEGPIRYADLRFAGFQIPDQTFIQARNSPDMDEGVMGLNVGRNRIWRTLKTAAGYSPLQRILSQEDGPRHIMTFLLGRLVDPDKAASGMYTIGSILPGYEDIEKQPKLEYVDGHFKFMMDDVTKVLIDTGMSFNQVPQSVAKDIYAEYRGAERVRLGSEIFWAVPCTEEVRLTFQIQGKNFFIHPLDMTLHSSQTNDTITSKNGEEMCLGSFQPMSINTKETNLILGMPFLRNVYALIDFGKNVIDNEEDGYMQLLSTTTDIAEAHKDFERVRCKGQPCSTFVPRT